MIALPRVAGRIFGTPLAIERGKLDVILAAVEPRLFGEGKLTAEWGDESDPDDPDDPGYTVTPDGTAVLPIHGTLVSKTSGMDAPSGMQSYGQIRSAFQGALADPQVRTVLFDVDSPGGETQGMFDLADTIFQARGQKPMAAYCAPAYSAAYMLASAADQVMVPQDSGVGSVGVIALHMDRSAADAQAGRKYTAIYAGARKNDGNPHEPLTPEATSRMQGRIDQTYELFVAAVARNRGMSPEAVRGTDALTYMGAAAVKKGMADSVGTPEQLLGQLATAGAVGRKTLWSLGGHMPAIAVHHTATSDGSWDGPANETRLPSEKGLLHEAHAWVDAAGDPNTKAAYKFIHHEVSADGKVGAANLTGCSTGIGVLNGGRGGTTIPDADREGVHAHLAAHLRDAGKDVPKLDGTAATAAQKEGNMEKLNGAAEPKVPTAAEIDAMIAGARSTGYAEAQSIVDLCAIAGAPQKAGEFIAAKETAEQVRAKLLQAKVAAEKTLNPEMLPGGKDPKAQGKAKPWKEILQVLGFRKQEGK